jgi:hypothetical protein
MRRHVDTGLDCFVFSLRLKINQTLRLSDRLYSQTQSYFVVRPAPDRELKFEGLPPLVEPIIKSHLTKLDSAKLKPIQCNSNKIRNFQYIENCTRIDLIDTLI